MSFEKFGVSGHEGGVKVLSRGGGKGMGIEKGRGVKGSELETRNSKCEAVLFVLQEFDMVEHVFRI